MKILITGGAGYIGTTLIPMLLSAGHEVTVFDNLSFGGEVLIPFLQNRQFKFIKGDVRHFESLQKAVQKQNVVIHLAALAGYKICDLDKEAAYTINVVGTQNLINCLTKEQTLIYSSTGCNYGNINIDTVTEKTPLNPTSLYGETKTEAERLCMTRPNSLSFRFATAFGCSPRLRLDLLVNDMTYLGATQGFLVIYQSEFIRSFIHVQDMAKSIILAINNLDKMIDNVYNVGSESMAYCKRDLAELISKYTNCVVHYNDFDYDRDHRNYNVSYEKIKKLGYETTIDLEEGIKELLNAYKLLNLQSRKFYNIGE